MHVICLQLDIVWHDKPANHDKVARLLAAVDPAEGSLVVLPEMFATGFSMAVASITDSETRESQAFLAEVARRRRLYVMAGIVTSGVPGRGRNECVVYSPEGEEISRYAKLHPFGLGGETTHYESGDGIETFACGDLEIAPFICYDLRFPEVFRRAVQRGANLMTVIASWPDAREHHWVTLLQARAIENQAYVVGVNRCGTDPNLRYPGRSMIVGPDGMVLADAGAAEGVIRADLPVERLRSYREALPFLRDIRPDFA
jgi:omega-amidase